MYYLFKLYIKYLNLIRGIEAIRIFTKAISLNVLYPPQMDILKFVVKIHLNMAVLRQHPVPNAGPNPNNTGLLSELQFLAWFFQQSGTPVILFT